MKSVCILVQNHYDFDVRVRRKALALATAGYSVDVLALRSSPTRKSYTLDGAHVYTLSLGKRRGSLVRYAFEYVAFFLWALVRVTVQMRRRSYAAIDVNTLPDFLIFAAAFTRWKRAKLILDMHEVTPEFYISKYGIAENSWLVRLLKRVEKMSFGLADHVITVNEPIEDLLVDRGLPRSKSTVIMNAADEARFAPTSRSSPAADTVARGTFVMMYHGTLTDIYGLDIAIDAFGLVHHEMPGAELWILGDGPEKDRLETRAQRCGVASKVRLLGFVAPSEVPGWLSKCDIGILPMRRDIFLDLAFPNKLSEYVIMGKAVLAPRLKAIRHYFSDGALAYFEPNDPADLSKQMVRVSRDSGLRARLAARAWVEYAPIRWDVMKQRYLRLIEDMVGPGAADGGAVNAPEASVLPR